MEEQTLSLIMRSWSWNPVILVGLLLAAASYAFGFYYLHRHGRLQGLIQRGLIRQRQPWLFVAGLAALVIALLSPIDTLANMLFLAHMVQHVLLMMVAPPLLLLGLPSPLVRLFILETRVRGILERVTNPVAGYLLFNANLWLWHFPPAYEAALRNELIHDLEHALFFYTAILFWWRVIEPTGGWFPLWRWPPAKWLYLIVAAPPTYLLGSILWSSSTVFYPYYTQVPRLWGLSALADQQAGGFIMWIQGWMYVMLSLLVFFLWYEPEKEQV
ncbi:MAG: cytochrome c oxidase assembly protein [Ardenticatenaceae bacterium]